MAHASEAEEATAAEAVSADEELARALQREELHLRPRPRRRPNAKSEDTDRLEAALEAKELPSRNLSNGSHKRQSADDTSGSHASRDSRSLKRQRSGQGRAASPATNGGSSSDDARSELDGSGADRGPSTDGCPVDSVKVETWDAQEQGAMSGSRTPASIDVAHCAVSSELLMVVEACCSGRCEALVGVCPHSVDANESADAVHAICRQSRSSASAPPRKTWGRGGVTDAGGEAGGGHTGSFVRGDLGEGKRVKAVRLTTSMLRAMSTKDLQQVYFDSFGTETKAHNKDWIINKLTRSAAEVAAGGPERDAKSFTPCHNGDTKQAHMSRNGTATPKANGGVVGVTANGGCTSHEEKGCNGLGSYNGVRKCGNHVADAACRSQENGVHTVAVPSQADGDAHRGDAPGTCAPLDVVCSKTHTGMGSRMPPKLKWLAKFMEEDTSSDFIKLSGQLVR
eukprot:jgi/Mesvir1/23585/Mv18276-RA.1